MRKLSSDLIFYKSVAGNLVGPALLFGFVRFFWTKNYSGTTVDIAYSMIALLTILGWVRLFKHRRVFLGENTLSIGSYWTNKSLQIPISDIVSVVQISNFYRNAKNMPYKLTYLHNQKSHIAFFYKADDLYDLSNLNDLIQSSNTVK